MRISDWSSDVCSSDLPKLILMDEPFGALDALTREKMNLEMLRIWQQSRKTIIFVTHSIQEAVFLGSRCAVLTSGPARMADAFTIDLPFPRTLDMKTTERSEEHTSELQSLMRISYAVFCLKNINTNITTLKLIE